MTTPLVPRIQASSGQPATVRVGKVVQAEPSVIVSVQGTEFNDVGWLGSYLPSLGDNVILLGQSPASGPDQGSWVALGSVSGTVGQQVHIAKLERQAAQSIPIGSFQVIDFDTAIIDTMGGWDSGTPGIYTVPFDGFYDIRGRATFVISGVGQRQSSWFINGVNTETVITVQPPLIVPTNFAMYPHVVELSAGDEVEMAVWQNTAGPLATGSTATNRPQFSIRYLGEAVG